MNLQCFENMLGSYPETVNFLTALATPSIAFIALIFAAFQWHTNRNRLRHELFDARYRQYDAVKKFLGSLGASGKMTPESEVEFLRETKGIWFTFSEKIAKYVDDKVWALAVQLNLYNEEMKDPQRIEDGVAKQRGDLMKEIIKELRNSEDMFSKYLQLKH
ncbi:hypothetical protein [Kineobactrum salinum]|uniref:DUF4760 domain-containing protein n=1 Tax=Kineobactrum salinum TaxID=2708301 RepID=A0A6C0U4V3_9GAMM|nr:hypothetical protein [Kineobactrum salinum]QIB66958.1 hypothetical protein G3T16_17745 [Kineobactrum salinum]